MYGTVDQRSGSSAFEGKKVRIYTHKEMAEQKRASLLTGFSLGVFATLLGLQIAQWILSVAT